VEIILYEEIKNVKKQSHLFILSAISVGDGGHLPPSLEINSQPRSKYQAVVNEYSQNEMEGAL